MGYKKKIQPTNTAIASILFEDIKMMHVTKSFHALLYIVDTFSEWTAVSLQR